MKIKTCLLLLSVCLFTACGSIVPEVATETESVAGWETIPQTEQEPLANSSAEEVSTQESTEASLSESTSDEVSTEAVTEAATESASENMTEEISEETPMEELQPTLENQLASLPGVWSLYLKDLSTGEVISVNNEKMIAASLIKLYVAGAYMEQVEAGTVSADYEGQMDIMINQSDNNACNTLIDLVGMEQINSFISAHGFTNSVLNRKMLEKSANENYTSTMDCGTVLEEVLNGTYVSKDASERILQDLKDQQRTGKIPAGVPTGVVTANKTGELDNVENDAAIIWAPNTTYILCIMCHDAGDMSVARQDIINLSSTVYSAIGE